MRFDLAIFTKRRKQAYEALHPETRQHVAGAHASNRAQGNASANLAAAFTTDTATKTGQSERVIQRDADRGNRISERALALTDLVPMPLNQSGRGVAGGSVLFSLPTRKQAYEALHPETRNGATGVGRDKLRKVCEANPADRFTADTAEKTGQSERVRASCQIGDLKETDRNAPANLADVSSLRQVGEPSSSRQVGDSSNWALS